VSRTRNLILAMIAPLVWGTTYYVATEYLPAHTPMFTSMMRALPVGLIGLFAFRVFPRGIWWLRAAILGFLNVGLFFALLFVAADRLPGGVAGTLVATMPLVVIGLGWLLLRDHPDAGTLISAVIGIIGVALLVLTPAAHFDIVGVLAAIGAAISGGGGLLLTKHWGRPVGLLPFTAWQLSAAGLMLLPVALLVDGVPSGIDSPAIIAYAWLTLVCTGIAFALWFSSIDHLSPATVALMLPLSPLVAVVIGVVLADERPGVMGGIGIGLVIFSVVLGQVIGSRSAARLIVEDAAALPVPDDAGESDSQPVLDQRMGRVEPA
jgi:probable blue pigment (indigoidine) exporter